MGLPILLLLAAGFAGQSPVQALDPAHDKILYMVADAHLDDEWNWTIQDTINSYIPATLHTNFALLAAYPHYIFNWEESWRYQLAQQWADLTSANGAYGVSILNDCKYGWDKPDNSTLMPPLALTRPLWLFRMGPLR
jgi:alpha-mannosidase